MITPDTLKLLHDLLTQATPGPWSNGLRGSGADGAASLRGVAADLLALVDQ